MQASDQAVPADGPGRSRKPALSPSLKGRALRLLSQREHTRRELERKLARFEEVPGALAQALDDLQARGFLDEHRAAESLAHRRASAYGAARLRQEMQDKGLGRELITQTLAGLQSSEETRARQVWQRRFEAAPADAKERARQARFLLARGFSGDVVRRVLADKGLDPDGEV
ncbi:recombinase RecX [Hylemonella gracilis str. Niagara R]|uniref:Regulatory protein RecX n=1 Tax=Hylemonella gracilis str. Niagara R TaxID=1458275 RepID=A0A016XFB6_9BURK|nr:recombination regulator RecX [Hylemonella gracilis]EYC49913.1 recombinase RecX [Hylemonella gracilis str. Niagara R]